MNIFHETDTFYPFITADFLLLGEAESIAFAHALAAIDQPLIFFLPELLFMVDRAQVEVGLECTKTVFYFANNIIYRPKQFFAHLSGYTQKISPALPVCIHVFFYLPMTDGYFALSRPTRSYIFSSVLLPLFFSNEALTMGNPFSKPS
jgi:hypothetical protein